MSEVIPTTCEITGAIVYRRGNLLHRKDGPAVVFPDGVAEWWVQGCKVINWKDWKFLTQASDEDLVYYKLKYGEDCFDAR